MVQASGFDPVVKTNGREVLRRLHEAADIDVVIVDAGIPEPPLPYLLAQLRGDVNFGLLPVIIVAPTDYAGVVPDELERGLNRFVQGYRNVWVVSRTFDQKFWKQTLTERVNESQGSPLTKEERVANAKLAMQWLRRLAVGEVPGFDVRPAEPAILKALRSVDLESEAIPSAGRLPGRRAKRRWRRRYSIAPRLHFSPRAPSSLPGTFASTISRCRSSTFEESKRFIGPQGMSNYVRASLSCSAASDRARR